MWPVPFAGRLFRRRIPDKRRRTGAQHAESKLWLRPQTLPRRNAHARPEKDLSSSAGTAGFGTSFSKTALVFSVLLFGVNRSAMACSAALIFWPSDSLSGERMP
jgi:hypothetical protein